MATVIGFEQATTPYNRQKRPPIVRRSNRLNLHCGSLRDRGGPVTDSIRDITIKSDGTDDALAVNAAASAVSAMRKQLEGTIRDNAFWDDACEKVRSPDRDDWITENWRATTEAYPLYDTAIVVDASGTSVMVYENGETVGGSIRL